MTVQRILWGVGAWRARERTTRAAVLFGFLTSAALMLPTIGGVTVAAQPAGASAVPAAEAPAAPAVDQLVGSPASVAPAGGGASPRLPDWAQRLPPGGLAWAASIDDAARRAGLDPRLLAAVVWVESGFSQSAASPAGALGLAQVMPTTADDLGVDPHNPLQNLAGGARYLRHQLDRFGSLELALAAYNAGPARVAGIRAVPDIPQTRQYVARVVAVYRDLTGAERPSPSGLPSGPSEAASG